LILSGIFQSKAFVRPETRNKRAMPQACGEHFKNKIAQGQPAGFACGFGLHYLEANNGPTR
jgi:hypothetical protein